MAKKHTLDKSTRPKAAYTMPAPNDDIHAYGWDLKNIRQPDPKSLNKKDPDAGKPIFSAPQETMKTMHRYGHDAQFICPKYLQIILDQATELRDVVLKAAETRYRVEDIDRVEAEVNRLFDEVVLPDIVKNFRGVARQVAQFYAARIAHIKKFGNESG
jgi:hypothetical protein